MSGKLVLVVGPSGAGKDSVLHGAKQRLNGSSRCFFPRRFITRDEGAGGEDHISLNPEEFTTMEERGDFALAWYAHDLSYGVPRTITRAMANGMTVVVNVSRSVIEEAMERFPDVRVVNITASRDVLKQRLTDRGRESEEDVERRLERATAFYFKGDNVFEIDNSGSLDDSVRQFLGLVQN